MIEYTVQVTADCTKWYLTGNLHREDGPAIERADGTVWYRYGYVHRTDGPAIEYTDGTKMWYIDGKRHRTDGPAIEYIDGTKQWFLNGVEVTEADVVSPTKEMSIAELEAVLGHKVKVVK